MKTSPRIPPTDVFTRFIISLADQAGEEDWRIYDKCLAVLKRAEMPADADNGHLVLAAYRHMSDLAETLIEEIKARNRRVQ
jgi:hypothetical protein